MQKLKKSPALERIRELFRYDAHSGIFTRAVTNRRWKEGEPAGCVDKDGYILINVDGMQHRAHRLAWLYVH